MIEKKYADLIEVLMMSTTMCFFMSLIMTFVHLGFTDNYIASCLKAFFHGLLVAIPVGLIISPLVKRFAKKITG